jgi:hypothetical protein
MPTRVWALVDELRQGSSRGVFLTACVYRAHFRTTVDTR